MSDAQKIASADVDLSSAMANRREITTHGSITTENMPDVDFTPVIGPAQAAGYTIVTVMGSQPKGQEHSPRQPYTWDPESINDCYSAIEPTLWKLLSKHKKVLVLARVDAYDAGFAALKAVADITKCLQRDQTKGVHILGQPVETFTERRRWKRGNPFQDEREQIAACDSETQPNCFRPCFDALSEYVSKMDWRGVEWGMVRHADQVLVCQNPKFHPTWENLFKAQCSANNSNFEAKCINLHGLMTSQKGGGTAASFITESVGASFIEKHDDMYAGNGYDGEDNRALVDLPQDEYDRRIHEEKAADTLLGPDQMPEDLRQIHEILNDEQDGQALELEAESHELEVLLDNGPINAPTTVVVTKTAKPLTAAQKRAAKKAAAKAQAKADAK